MNYRFRNLAKLAWVFAAILASIVFALMIFADIVGMQASLEEFVPKPVQAAASIFLGITWLGLAVHHLMARRTA